MFLENVFVTNFFIKSDNYLFEVFKYQNRYKKSGALKAMIFLHGGPHARWDMGYNRIALDLAKNDYDVFCPNIRGSSGYGEDFQNCIDYDWGGKDLFDVNLVVEHLFTKNYVSKNISIFGQSYGGYLGICYAYSNFCAVSNIISWSGFSDLFYLYETSPKVRELLMNGMGHPVINYDLWRERSPYFKNTQKIKMDLLIIHSKDDVVIPIINHERFHQKLLKYSNYTTKIKFYIAEGGHEDFYHIKQKLIWKMIGWFIDDC